MITTSAYLVSLLSPDYILVQLDQGPVWRVDDDLAGGEVLSDLVDDGAGHTAALPHVTQHQHNVPVLVDHLEVLLSQSYLGAGPVPGDPDVGVGLHPAVEKQIGSGVDDDVPELLGEERRHIAVQPLVHDDRELAPHTPELVESLHAVLAGLVDADVVHLEVLEVRLVVDVGVLVLQDLL